MDGDSKLPGTTLERTAHLPHTLVYWLQSLCFLGDGLKLRYAWKKEKVEQFQCECCASQQGCFLDNASSQMECTTTKTADFWR